MSKSNKDNLPLAEFHSVREVHIKSIHRGNFLYEGHQVLIALDPNAGKSGRYSIIHIHRETGQATMIGRELPLYSAGQLVSDFMRGLGENHDGSEAHTTGYSGTRKLYERGNP